MMDDWSLHDRVAASISFRLKDHNGQVSVFYGASNDPVRAGFDSLPGLSFDIDRCQGYPVMHARIERYEGSGYRTFCGWVQVVTNLYLDSHDPEKAQSESFVSVDVAPAFQEANIPFASYGNLPQFFDAPCLNLGRYAELRWTADISNFHTHTIER